MHGGSIPKADPILAEFWKSTLRRGLRGVIAAARTGTDVLNHSGSAVDAVEEAVASMEENPAFEAGIGSPYSLIRTIEMDAAIMDGRDLSAGAVTLSRNIKNPVRAARLVMEKTDHVLMAGPAVDRLATLFRLPKSKPGITAQREVWRKLKAEPASWRDWLPKNLQLLAEHPEAFRHETVGAVAVDAKGNFAAAASTGGLTMKLPGRIGDTPIIGAGLYADNLSGAATVTGIGEVAIKLALSKEVCSMMSDGLSALGASIRGVTTASIRLKGDMGVIAIDRSGRIASVHNSPYMPWAFSTTKMRKPEASLRGKIVAPLF